MLVNLFDIYLQILATGNAPNLSIIQKSIIKKLLLQK